MKMEVNSVERDSEPFDFRILIPFVGYQQKGQQPFPTNPVVHKAYFAFDSLIPVEEQDDFRILIPFVGYQQKGQQPFPTNPVVHKAYFVFDSLIPVEEQEKAP